MNDVVSRLIKAEEILAELSSGYWVAVLDNNSDEGDKIGQKVLNYWRGVE